MHLGAAAGAADNRQRDCSFPKYHTTCQCRIKKCVSNHPNIAIYPALPPPKLFLLLQMDSCMVCDFIVTSRLHMMTGNMELTQVHSRVVNRLRIQHVHRPELWCTLDHTRNAPHFGTMLYFCFACCQIRTCLSIISMSNNLIFLCCNKERHPFKGFSACCEATV